MENGRTMTMLMRNEEEEGTPGHGIVVVIIGIRRQQTHQRPSMEEVRLAWMDRIERGPRWEGSTLTRKENRDRQNRNKQ